MSAKRPPLLVEGCAGTAALSLRLADAKARPPVARMGNKTGYADAILRTLGLSPGSGASRYLWAEPDPEARGVLESYLSEQVSRDAASLLRSWNEVDPLLLWETLRQESEHATDAGTARSIARSVWLIGRSYAGRGSATGFKHSTYLNGVPNWSAWEPEYFAKRVESLPALSASIVDDVRSIDPAALPEGSIVYLDPPYAGTTGYSHDLDRREVVRLALRFAACGAVVAISEAEPIKQLVRIGWHAVDLTNHRRGKVGGAKRRVWSKQQREILTLSKRPKQIGRSKDRP